MRLVHWSLLLVIFIVSFISQRISVVLTSYNSMAFSASTSGTSFPRNGDVTGIVWLPDRTGIIDRWLSTACVLWTMPLSCLHCCTSLSQKGDDFSRNKITYWDKTKQILNINVEVLLPDSHSRSSKESIPSISVQEPLDDVFSGNVVEWPNPLGVQDKLLHRSVDFALNTDHSIVIAKNKLKS